jgi:hypothetical protein
VVFAQEWALETETVCLSEMLVPIYESTWWQKAEQHCQLKRECSTYIQLRICSSGFGLYIAWQMILDWMTQFNSIQFSSTLCSGLLYSSLFWSKSLLFRMDSICMWTEHNGPWWFQPEQQIKTNIRSRLMHNLIIYQNVQYLRNKTDQVTVIYRLWCYCW